jgi:hypothetical protein
MCAYPCRACAQSVVQSVFGSVAGVCLRARSAAHAAARVCCGGYLTLERRSDCCARAFFPRGFDIIIIIPLALGLLFFVVVVVHMAGRDALVQIIETTEYIGLATARYGERAAEATAKAVLGYDDHVATQARGYDTTLAMGLERATSPMERARWALAYVKNYLHHVPIARRRKPARDDDTAPTPAAASPPPEEEEHPLAYARKKLGSSPKQLDFRMHARFAEVHLAMDKEARNRGFGTASKSCGMDWCMCEPDDAGRYPPRCNCPFASS